MKFLVVFVLMFVFENHVFASEVPYIEGADSFNSTVYEMADGSFNFDVGEIINKAIEIFTDEITNNTGYLILFFILGAVSALVNLMDFKDKGTAETSFFACYTLCAGVCLKLFSNILEYATDVTDNMADFITKLSPVLTTLLLTSGKAVSASVFHPVLMAAVYVVTIVVKKCIIPLAVYSAVLNVVNNINEQVQISSFCKLLSSASKWILAASFTLFTGICGIYGFSAPSLDIMGAKTVKFAVGSLVPVVGGFLSDTLETVVSGSLMMKNVVGGAGLFALCTICLLPILKMSVMLLMIRLSAAIVEPITDKRIAKLISDMSGVITIIFAMVITISVLFIICISIIISATG